MGFSQQEYWSGWTFPPPGDLPNLGIKSPSPVVPALAGRLSHLETPPQTMEPTKKGSPASKEKKKPQQDGRSGAIMVKLNPILARWVTHKLENNIPQKLYHSSEIPESHIRLPSLGVSGNGRKSPQTIWLWGPVGFDPRTSTGLRETNSTTRGGTQSLLCTRTQGKKQWPHKTEPDLAAGIGGSPAEVGAAVAHCRDKDTGSSSLGKNLLLWALQEAAMSPSSSLWSPVLGCFGSNNQQGGNTAPPINRQVA